MSVATELPPVVFIPEQARTVRRPQLRVLAVSAPCTPEKTMPVTTPLPRPLAASPTRVLPHPVDVRSPQSVRIAAPIGSTASGLRLTTRGLVAAWAAGAIVVGLLLAAAYLSWRPSAAPISSSRPVGTVRVQPGDTLWSIAERVAPGRDPRNVVADLRAVNHLQGASLVPGQLLTVG